MANVSANFTANFSSFYAAVEKAEVTLKDFGDGAEKAGTKLERLANQFSGKQIVQQATLVTEAVERIGGVSKLTENELARVGSTVSEAAEKMRKLGLEVPANFQAIESATKKTTTSTQSWISSLTDAATLIRGFIALQAVQYVISFGKEILAEADALKKLSAQTSISTDWIQRFQIATDDAGGSIQDIGNAIFQLQKRLGDNDKTATAAIEALGLSVQHLRSLSPEQQFLAIANALKAIEDPMKFAAEGTAIFGRSFQQVAPVIKRGMDDIATASAGMSQETIDNLSAMNNAFKTFERTVKATAANAFTSFLHYRNIALGVKEIDLVTAALEKQLAAQLKLTQAKGLPAGLPTIAGPSEQEIRELDQALEKRNQTLTKQKKITDDQIEANRQAKLSIVDLEGVAEVYAGQIRTNMKVFEVAIDQQKTWIDWSQQAQKDNADIGKKIRAMSAAEIQADVREQSAFFDETFAYLAKVPDAFVGPIDQAGKQFQKFGDYIASELPRTILAAVQGGGSVLQSIGSTIGTYLLDPKMSGIGAAITKGASQLPGLIGNAVSSVLPGVGALIGPAIEGVKKLFGKMFGAEQKEVNKFRDQFVAAAGGILQLNQAAATAGVTLDNLLGAKKQKEYEAAANTLTQALTFQKDAMALLQETAARYGFTIEELGPAMARQELDKQAQQLFKDWEVLNAAGIDTIAITSRMAETMNEYLKTAMSTGTEVPAAMKPMIEQMIAMGKLTDASGETIESLEEAGISFALSMSEGFKTLIDEVKKLTDAISRGLGTAIRNVPPLNVPVNAPAAEMPSYQGGTGGFKNFGKGTPVMLHGWEAVVPRDETGGAFATVSGASGPAAGAAAAVSVVIHAEGAFFDTPGDLQRLADKVNDALTAKFGLRNSMRAA